MRHLLETHESWSDEGGEFTHVGYVIAWEEDGKVFRLEHEGTTFDLERLEAPSPIPPEYLTTPWLSGYVDAPQPLPPTTFVKSIPPIRYTPHAPMVPSQLMRKEIEVYTALLRAPHPNICPFYGCVRDGQRATALVLKKVPHELPDQWRSATPDIIVPKLVILRGVKRGLDHLHGLGIVHNDINKANILLDESLDPVIIDFNIALPEGEPRDEWLGTPGWFKKSPISSRGNDIFALGLIAKWLDGWEEDPSSFIELEEPCSWTEDYLAPKILAVGASSRLYNDILSRASYLGAYLTLLNVPESDSLDIPSRHLNERIKTTSANSHEEYIQVWAEACAGLRSKELDVVFFPISKHILDPNSEQLRQLRNLIAAIPYNLRLLRMQPRLILFDVDSSAFGPSEVSRLETVLRTLTQECWKDGASNMNKHVPNSDDHRNGDGVEALEVDAPRNTNDVFGNFVLAQPGGWFSWSRLRVRLWQTVGAPSVPSFKRTSHLVAPDDLVGFVLEPPRRRRSSSWRSLASATTRVMGIDDPALFTFVFAQAALTVYAAYKLAWAN